MAITTRTTMAFGIFRTHAHIGIGIGAQCGLGYRFGLGFGLRAVFGLARVDGSLSTVFRFGFAQECRAWMVVLESDRFLG